MLVLQATAGLEDFSKIITMTRTLLMHHPVAAVLELLLDHINFEEYVMSGEAIILLQLAVAANNTTSRVDTL